MYEVLGKLPRHGVGARIQRNTWYEDSFWDVVDVKIDMSGKTGKAYGMLTWKGKQVHEEPIRIPGSLKKVWKAIIPEATREPWSSLDKDLLQSVEKVANDDGHTS